MLRTSNLNDLFILSPSHSASLQALSLRGNRMDGRDQFSTTALQRVCMLLPGLKQLRLSGLAIYEDIIQGNRPIYQLRTLELDNIHPCQSHGHDFGGLLSLFDVETLRILGLPSHPSRKAHEAHIPSLNTAYFNSANRPATGVHTRPKGSENLVVGVRNLHMDCSTSDILGWLECLMSNADSRGRESRHENILCHVEIACEDMHAAYALGDFLRGPAGASVERLVLDLGRLCQRQKPCEFTHSPTTYSLTDAFVISSNKLMARVWPNPSITRSNFAPDQGSHSSIEVW